MVTKPDTWWDVWLPERVLTEQMLLDAAEKPTNINWHDLLSRPMLVWDDTWPCSDGFYYTDWRLTRTRSENLNRKISSGIDLGYTRRKNSPSIIIDKELPKNTMYMIDYETLYKKEINPYETRDI